MVQVSMYMKAMLASSKGMKLMCRPCQTETSFPPNSIWFLELIGLGYRTTTVDIETGDMIHRCGMVQQFVCDNCNEVQGEQPTYHDLVRRVNYKVPHCTLCDMPMRAFKVAANAGD